VAKEAGVSRGLVYHYFPNKKDFYSAIVRYGMRNAFELTAPDTSLPPDQWLTNSVERLLHYVETNADAFRAVFSGRHSVDEEVRDAIKENRTAQVARLCELVSPEEPASETLQLGIESWIAMLDTMMLEWLDGRRIEREKFIQLASGMLVMTIGTAMRIDGRTEKIKQIAHLVPVGFFGE
jgi:AcrR family transcriptional regulator